MEGVHQTSARSADKGKGGGADEKCGEQFSDHSRLAESLENLGGRFDGEEYGKELRQ